MIFIAVLKMIITFVMMKGSRDTVMMMMMNQVFDTMAKKGLETLKEEENRRVAALNQGGCCCTIC